MKQTFLGLLFICFSFASYGQVGDFLFKYFKEKKSVTYGLNNRRTTVFQDKATIYGGYLGIKFGSQLKHVITLNSTVFWVGDYVDESGLNMANEVQLNFVGFSEEFVFWRRNQWAFSSYLHFGLGKAKFRENNAVDILENRLVYPLEFGIHSGYSPTEWLEFRLGGGYRYVLNSGEVSLHGFYYKIGAGLNLQKCKDWTKSILVVGKRVDPKNKTF